MPPFLGCSPSDTLVLLFFSWGLKQGASPQLAPQAANQWVLAPDLCPIVDSPIIWAKYMLVLWPKLNFYIHSFQPHFTKFSQKWSRCIKAGWPTDAQIKWLHKLYFPAKPSYKCSCLIIYLVLWLYSSQCYSDSNLHVFEMCFTMWIMGRTFFMGFADLVS